ncbi:calcium ion transporter [Moniliophthora roreri MCA 2997]|uniref:Vacuolar calcium ion transporter n=2 Tax=Moniliophthora roreri TaxID=221103 RepID=V2XF18_MONRO|nr:calcium ion transporter [Moniliophthora roreri MCA 2997]KAI3616909.1 calcium ion transporter [Moniliophthora roreri]
MSDHNSTSTNATKNNNNYGFNMHQSVIAEDDDEPPGSPQPQPSLPTRQPRRRNTSPSLPMKARMQAPGLIRQPPSRQGSMHSVDGNSMMVRPPRRTSLPPPHLVVEPSEKASPQEVDIEAAAPANTTPASPQAVDYAAKHPRGNFTSKLGRITALFTPVKPLGPTPTYRQSAIAAIRYTPLNICLLFIPVSWALHFTHQSDTLIFVFSALGIIPLAALLGLGTEQIALRTSSSVGGLLNATLGNVVEMIIAGIALKRCELELVQSSLLGGLLSNLLLVLGMAFLVGGYRFHQQEFQPLVAQLNSSLMTVAVISLIVPAAFHGYLGDRLPQGEEVTILLELSRGSAIILILIYIAYLFFQFYSHNHLFLDTLQSSPSSINNSTSSLPIDPTQSSETITSHEYAELNTPTAIFLLVASTALAYETAENLVSSLEGLVAANPSISKEWLTLIIIPIISNAAEHTTAVVVASKGKFDLAMSVAVGSCIQIALFVIPLLVLVAWGMGRPLTLLFDEVETLVLFFSVILVKFSVEDGKSHWMSGVVLVAVYIIIALSFWNFPLTERLVQGQHLSC